MKTSSSLCDSLCQLNSVTCTPRMNRHPRRNNFKLFSSVLRLCDLSWHLVSPANIFIPIPLSSPLSPGPTHQNTTSTETQNSSSWLFLPPNLVLPPHLLEFPVCVNLITGQVLYYEKSADLQHLPTSPKAAVLKRSVQNLPGECASLVDRYAACFLGHWVLPWRLKCLEAQSN